MPQSPHWRAFELEYRNPDVVIDGQQDREPKIQLRIDGHRRVGSLLSQGLLGALDEISPGNVLLALPPRPCLFFKQHLM